MFVLPGNSKKEGGGSKREGSSREKGRDRERDREKESSRRNVDGDNREQERSSKDSKQSNWGIYFSLTSYYSHSLSPSLSLSLTLSCSLGGGKREISPILFDRGPGIHAALLC